MTAFWGQKFRPPIKPNLAMAEQSSQSAWIFDLEFFKHYFCASQGPTQAGTTPPFLISKKAKI
jgi:hypothetical protein